MTKRTVVENGTSFDEDMHVVFGYVETVGCVGVRVQIPDLNYYVEEMGPECAPPDDVGPWVRDIVGCLVYCNLIKASHAPPLIEATAIAYRARGFTFSNKPGRMKPEDMAAFFRGRN